MHVQLTRENADRLARLSIQCDRPVGALANLIVQAVVEAGGGDVQAVVEIPDRRAKDPAPPVRKVRRERPVEAPWQLPAGWRVRV
jgi:hypothetical protein